MTSPVALADRRSFVLLLAVTALAASGCEQTTTPGTDGGVSGPCTSDDDCDDGVFCNGEERCAPSADARSCVAGTLPCTTCDEAADRCEEEECDADGDGARSIACGGGDCDDDDPERSPTATEVCDGADRDEDCDATTFGVRDADHDDEPDAACCNVDSAGASHCGTDCDDTRAGVSPTATETCNLRDDDCDTRTDEGVLVTFFADDDGDDFGDPDGATMMGCAQPPMYSDTPTDCDDAHASAHPGGVEVCDVDAIDEDCDGEANPVALCSCTGTEMRSCPLPGACAGSTQRCMSGVWGPCSVPPSPESCNMVDDNCDGTVDEGTLRTCYADPDEDGYAEASATVTMHCTCPIGTTERAPSGAGIDCRERDAASHPTASELCDRIDNDCSSGGGVETAEDVDNDGRAPLAALCTGGPFPRDDCGDLNANVRPGQTTFFPTLACPSTFPVPCSVDLGSFGGYGEWCQLAGTSCVLGAMPQVPGSWDYNCDGSLTREPSSGTSCSISGSCSGFPGECGAGGFAASSALVCGQSGTDRVCGCYSDGINPPGCRTISSVSRALRCR